MAEPAPQQPPEFSGVKEATFGGVLGAFGPTDWFHRSDPTIIERHNIRAAEVHIHLISLPLFRSSVLLSACFLASVSSSSCLSLCLSLCFLIPSSHILHLARSLFDVNVKIVCLSVLNSNSLVIDSCSCLGKGGGGHKD